MNDEAITRKNNSIQILKQRNVPYIDHLPCIETKNEVRIRTKEEIAQRAIASLIITQLACDISEYDDEDYILKSKEFTKKLLNRYGVAELITPKEQHIFESDVTSQEALDLIWKYEAYWILLWSLGVVTDLKFPSDTCDCDFAIHAVSQCDSFQDFMDKTTLRSIDEILDQTDLIFRYDWACVDARIKGRPAPAHLDSSVVLERHRALNWLIDMDQDDDWDNVSTDT